MILPSKHVPPERALLGVGAEVLRAMDQPSTIASLWDKMRSYRSADSKWPVLDYRWFVLAIDLLYMIGAVELDRGLLRKASV